MTPAPKPPQVPHDLWRTCNHQQQRWIIEVERDRLALKRRKPANANTNKNR